VSPHLPLSPSARLVLFVSLLFASAARPDAPPPLPEVLPSQPLVKDAVFAILVGLVESDTYGTLTSEHLGRDLERRGARSRLPFRKLRELRRAPGQPGRTAQVEAVFDGPLEMPVPYTILGYHPGSLRADEVCAFTEWRLGTVVVAAPSGPLAIQDVRVFSFRSGRIRIDFDGWLDWLMGGALDDTNVSGIATFRLRARWIGMAVGWNDKGEPRSGSFDFEQDKVLIPPSEELRAVARHLRRRLAELPREVSPLDGGSAR
jgi:hypothetical protein